MLSRSGLFFLCMTSKKKTFRKTFLFIIVTNFSFSKTSLVHNTQWQNLALHQVPHFLIRNMYFLCFFSHFIRSMKNQSHHLQSILPFWHRSMFNVMRACNIVIAISNLYIYNKITTWTKVLQTNNENIRTQ